MNWMKLLQVLMVATLVGDPTVVIAQPKQAVSDMAEAETLARTAKDLFAAKDFTAAATLFMKAYVKSHSPALVYNAARSYEETGDKAVAIATFRLYVTLSTDPNGIKDAKDRMAKLEQDVIAQSSQQPVAKPAVVAEPVAPIVPAIKTTIAKPSQAKSNVAAWVTTGSTALAGGTGISLMLVGKDGTKQAVAQRNQPAWENSRTTWMTGAILTGTGVILAGVSTYLWLSTKSVTVLPTADGIVVGGAF